MKLILITLLVFHFDISGNDFNDEHLKNKSSMQLTLPVFHFEISGNDFNDKHLINKLLISITLLVSNEDKSIVFKFLQYANKHLMLIKFSVLKEDKLISSILQLLNRSHIYYIFSIKINKIYFYYIFTIIKHKTTIV